jgi:CMP-N-acetylneuraminic acid synthetase
VPNKNFREMHTKPLYCWALEALINSQFVERIVNNTDAVDLVTKDPRVFHKKVQLRNRHRDLIGDEISMNLIIEDDLKHIDGDQFLMTHVTNPLVQPKTFDEAISFFHKASKNNEYDSLFSVNKMQERLYRDTGVPINHDPRLLLPTQFLEPIYKENSNIYIFTRESFLKTNARIGSRPFMFEMDETESIDIDNHQDWLIAEALIEKRERGI